jgi:hypothetical protein
MRVSYTSSQVHLSMIVDKELPDAMNKSKAFSLRRDTALWRVVAYVH